MFHKRYEEAKFGLKNLLKIINYYFIYSEKPNGVHFSLINFSLKLCSLKAAETLQINTDTHGYMAWTFISVLGRDDQIITEI